MNALFLFCIAVNFLERGDTNLSLGQSLKFLRNNLAFNEYYQKHVTRFNFMNSEIIEIGAYIALKDYYETEEEDYKAMNPDVGLNMYNNNRLLLKEFREYIISSLVIRKNVNQLEALYKSTDKEIETIINELDRRLYNYVHYIGRFVFELNSDDLLKARKMISDAIKYRKIYEKVAIKDEMIVDILNNDLGARVYKYICPNCGTNSIRETQEYCCKCGKKIHWNINRECKNIIVKKWGSYY